MKANIGFTPAAIAAAPSLDSAAGAAQTRAAGERDAHRPTPRLGSHDGEPRRAGKRAGAGHAALRRSRQPRDEKCRDDERRARRDAAILDAGETARSFGEAALGPRSQRAASYGCRLARREAQSHEAHRCEARSRRARSGLADRGRSYGRRSFRRLAVRRAAPAREARWRRSYRRSPRRGPFRREPRPCQARGR